MVCEESLALEVLKLFGASAARRNSGWGGLTGAGGGVVRGIAGGTGGSLPLPLTLPQRQTASASSSMPNGSSSDEGIAQASSLGLTHLGARASSSLGLPPSVNSQDEVVLGLPPQVPASAAAMAAVAAGGASSDPTKVCGVSQTLNPKPYQSMWV